MSRGKICPAVCIFFSLPPGGVIKTNSGVDDNDVFIAIILSFPEKTGEL